MFDPVPPDYAAPFYTQGRRGLLLCDAPDPKTELVYLGPVNLPTVYPAGRGEIAYRHWRTFFPRGGTDPATYYFQPISKE